MHPLYDFDVRVKQTTYETILKALEGKQVNLAMSLPNYSEYIFEKKLINRFPNVRIDCFERDFDTFLGVSTSLRKTKPDNVTLINSTAEEYISSRGIVYDLMFLDLCGVPDKNICNWAYDHLTSNGIFALTEARGRVPVSKRFANTNPKLYPVILPAEYSGMTFMLFRKDTKPIVTIPCDLAAISHRHVEVNDTKRIQGISSEDQKTWDMFKKDNMSCLDIAKTLGITDAGVRYRLHKVESILNSSVAPKCLRRTRGKLRQQMLDLLKRTKDKIVISDRCYEAIYSYIILGQDVNDVAKRMQTTPAGVHAFVHYGEEKMLKTLKIRKPVFSKTLRSSEEVKESLRGLYSKHGSSLPLHAKNILDFYLVKGLNQEQLAQKLDIPRRNVSPRLLSIEKSLKYRRNLEARKSN
jgi:predicted DNA-binding protein YlxM (UPF0122 family)